MDTKYSSLNTVAFGSVEQVAVLFLCHKHKKSNRVQNKRINIEGDISEEPLRIRVDKVATVVLLVVVIIVVLEVIFIPLVLIDDCSFVMLTGIIIITAAIITIPMAII